MDRLWSPWRSEYIASGGAADSESKSCVFCNLHADVNNDEANFVVYRASRSFIVLNRYPYISGHLLIVPNEHVGELDAAPKETTDELMDLTKRSQTALREVYQPEGFQYRHEPWPLCGRGDCRPHSYPHHAPLDGGHKLHDHGQRDAGYP